MTAALPLWAMLPFLVAQTNGHLSVGEVPKVVAKRGSSVQVKIPVIVDPGFHVNSNTPTLDYLIPLKLIWTEPANPASAALQAGPLTFPKPTLEKYEFVEKPLSVFTGKFDVIATFKVSDQAPGGPGIKVGKLRYQACNDRACFPPKTVDVTIPYQVQ